MGQVAKKENTAVSTEVVGYHKQEILSSDVPIPRLYLMQKGSELVEEGKAQVGDFIRSTNGEKLGDAKTPVLFIPLRYSTSWAIMEKQGDRFKWKRNEPRNAGNENLPWFYEENGVAYKRMKTIDLFAMLPHDMEDREKKVQQALAAGELPEPMMPILITFRSTSFEAGKAVTKYFAQIEEMVSKYKQTVAPYMYALPLTNERVKNEDMSWQVMVVGKAQKVSPEVANEAAHWYKILTDSSRNLEDLNIDKDESEDAAAIQKANQVRAKEQRQF